MSFLGQDEQIREYQFRFKYLYLVLGLSFTLLLGRLWYLQVIRGDQYRLYSEENRIKRVKIPSPRGMIFDRNKNLLVDNRPAFDLEIIPEELYASKTWKKTIKRIAPMVSMTEADVLKALKKARRLPRFMPVRVKEDLNQEELATIEAHKLDLPGVTIQLSIKRTNIFGDLAAHIMGYIGEVNSRELKKLNKTRPKGTIPYKIGNVLGKSGLEKRWESTLRGFDGVDYIEVDALGHRRRKRDTSIASGLKHKAAVPGKNLILTIDQDLQTTAQDAFEEIYKGKQIGAVIALDPKSGEVLAAVSQPSYDPTEFSRGVSSNLWSKLLNNDFHPLRDKTIQDHYSPGSTFKVVTALAGLEEGVINENTTFNCSGSIRSGNRHYRCWKRSGHGRLNLIQAMAQSCDVYFYRIGQKIGIDTLAKYAKMFGLGKKTGINLAHEQPGLIPTEAWKRRRFGQEWIPGETLSCAIGQSFVLTTPIQLANLYAAIASGGLLWRPYIVKHIESPEGRILKEFQPKLLSKINIKQKNIDLIHKSLAAVLKPRGTAFRYHLPGFDIAGKTGTTQVVRMASDKHVKCEDMPFNLRDHALFTAFAPLKDPKISVAVLALHACSGGRAASPIAMAVVKKFLQKYMPEKYSDEVIAKKIGKKIIKVPANQVPAGQNTGAVN